MAAEKTFENKVKDFLACQGAYFIKYWGGGTKTKAGVPDLIVCLNGCFLEVELKSSTGKPSMLQLENIKNIRKAGGIGIILYPEHFEEFKILCSKIRTGESYQFNFDSKLSTKDKLYLC